MRLYDGRVRTSLCWIDPQAGACTEFLELPSGGDTSYAGLVFHDGMLWVSYYSSHEGKDGHLLGQSQNTYLICRVSAERRCPSFGRHDLRGLEVISGTQIRTGYPCGLIDRVGAAVCIGPAVS